MEIWKRILLGFISVVAIMALIDYYALHNNKKVIRKIDALEHSKRLELSESSKIELSLQLITYTLLRLFQEQSGNLPTSDQAIYKTRVRENTVVLHNALKKLKEATTNDLERSEKPEHKQQEQEELLLIDSLNTIINQFSLSANQSMRLYELHRYNQARHLFRSQTEPTLLIAQGLIQHLKEDAQHEVRTVIKELDQNVERAVKAGITLTVLSILLSLAIGLYIARSISTPLKKLIQGTEAIRQGDLDTEVSLDAKGELLVLAESFNSMAQELKTKIAAINSLNEELAESNKTKDTFMSIISHDLKNPFNSILGFMNLLKVRYDEYNDADRKRMIETVNTSATGFYEMLENLLTWSRAQSGKIFLRKEPIQLNSIVATSIESFSSNAHQKEIVLLNKVASEHFVFADKHTLTVIINNLLNNAIKFTPPEGNIILSAEKEDGSIVLCVKDSGIGMEQERIDQLLQSNDLRSTPGTNNEKGTGLGLLIVKDFIKKNGGQLKIQSTPQVGSSFMVILPEHFQEKKKTEQKLLFIAEKGI
ncbi:sensor histidine kinase [Sunxiuqinia elliptica]|uniref:histidine kinase n=1 Tax=Sunxiuqinia elliptica TaxID=655355 RepID=A0A4R6HD45_9BACT|nr:HAMP domain-containing sensor histidine kinase [Sunxiuqinia elliptica]TDO05746.1 signal transduction histidine kinase [Sunxiuqinia elliptica]TDO65288.1 signal transduction histidine kinase [Sunxiuqinia elliptica]